MFRMLGFGVATGLRRLLPKTLLPPVHDLPDDEVDHRLEASLAEVRVRLARRVVDVLPHERMSGQLRYDFAEVLKPQASAGRLGLLGASLDDLVEIERVDERAVLDEGDVASGERTAHDLSLLDRDGIGARVGIREPGEHGPDRTIFFSRVLRNPGRAQMQQEAFGFEHGSVDEARLREHSADFTPGPVVYQGLEFVREFAPKRERIRIADVCAGAGVFGQQARKLWPKAHLTGIELRVEELPHLQAYYDEFSIGDARSILKVMAASGETFDLIATNPAFELFPELVELAPGVLTHDGILCLFGLSTWGQSAESYDLFCRHTPLKQARVGGRVHFRGDQINPDTGKPYGSDQRDYSWWTWRPGRSLDPPRWDCLQLPPLPGHARTWRGRPRPGTEHLTHVPKIGQ